MAVWQLSEEVKPGATEMKERLTAQIPLSLFHE